jgi:hypothetical protein
MWLEHLPSEWIQNWSDLKEIFMGNFQGTYERPENQWDLKNCRHKPEETLHEYILSVFNLQAHRGIS